MALPRAPLVGAHYYHWYPSNWGHGTLRAQLDPPQQPELGLYDSTDPAVAEQHIAWASAHGIDFFTLAWWPVAHQEHQTRPEESRAGKECVSTGRSRWSQYN